LNILFVHEIPYEREPVWEWHQLAELLAMRGHNIYIADYGSQRYHELDINRVYHGAKVHLIRPPSSGLGRLGYGFTYYNIIYKVLLDRRIDAIILYSAPTNGIQTVLAARKLGVPVIFRSIDVLHKLVPKVLSLPTALAERWVYRNTDRILTITPALSKYVTSLGANPDTVKVLPLGIDLDPLQDATQSKNNGLWCNNGIIYHTMVFAGTLPHFSGLPVLLGRMPELMKRIPNLRLLIVGDGKQRPELENGIQELGLGDCVKITGMVPHEDVPKWIAGADIGVLTFPTEGATRDIFPTKVLQYMAQGKPVVANPLPGLVDFGLGEEQGVVYIRNGDWGSAIEYAIRNRDMLGKKARRYVEQEHGYDRIVSRLEGELESLCRLR
jgi:glycosyltransferase involved in cell wall biosynthesis